MSVFIGFTSSQTVRNAGFLSRIRGRPFALTPPLPVLGLVKGGSDKSTPEAQLWEKKKRRRDKCKTARQKKKR